MEDKNESRLKEREKEREHHCYENHALIHFTQVVNSMQFTTLTLM